ncbi:hypothetical protein H1P_590015 [Hyella patelloides LEGE 07179]|uniref:Uncharacterized protein n=1 Tax=Hyella patelloides LEGE 07179 TaxID=945734 RepID=A0A563W1A6_9CYAN|nr:hypothetical protein H1P_590015 [Hyella patelloides LEGE 07179]
MRKRYFNAYISPVIPKYFFNIGGMHDYGLSNNNLELSESIDKIVLYIKHLKLFYRNSSI